MIGKPIAAGDLQSLPVRLRPGEDVRIALQEILVAAHCEAGFVLAGNGSLAAAAIRHAGAQHATRTEADLEILTLSGSVSPDAAHLHVSVADRQGRVSGGHVAVGCRVRTSAEVLLVLLPGWTFERLPDPATGHLELVARRKTEP